MLDRVPLYPGRVKLTPVSGQENVYDMVRADQPTQEGTPLNKASLLTDATAALFGLGSDAVPDDVFNQLGKLPNFYLWKKTIVVQQAGYTLSEVKHDLKILAAPGSGSSYYISIACYKEFGIDEYGFLDSSIEKDTSGSIYYTTYTRSFNDHIRGCYIYGTLLANQQYTKLEAGKYYFIPYDSEIRAYQDTSAPSSEQFQLIVSNYQEVEEIHPVQKSTEYLFSADKSAYTESDDAKPASYELGNEKLGSFNLTDTNLTTYYSYGSDIKISKYGTVSLVKAEGTTSIAGNIRKAEVLKGKFFVATHSNSTVGLVGKHFIKNKVYFMPQDANFTLVDNDVHTNKYQDVIAYAETPASTIIEYVGQLGDKTIITTGNYIGNGESTKTIDLGVNPKILILAEQRVSRNKVVLWITGVSTIVVGSSTSDELQISESEKSITLIAKDLALSAVNAKNAIYYYTVIS